MDKSARRNTLYGLLGLLSLLLSSLGYLYGHKLLMPQALVGVLSSLWRILVPFLLLSLSGALGERLLRWADISGLVRFALSTALGATLISIAALVLGSLLGTSIVVFALPALALIIVLRHDIAAWLRDLGELRSALRGGIYEKLMILAAAVILAVALLFALTPPIEFDALTYHLALPRAYLQQGRISYQPDNMFWGMPELVEMLFIPLMSAAGAPAAAVFMWMIGLTALVGLLGYMHSLFGGAVAWTAIIALMIGEALSRSLSTAYVDWMSILFGLGAQAALHAWSDGRDRRMLLLGGAFCGAALDTKYSAGVLLIGIAVAAFPLQRGEPLSRRIQSVLLVGAAAALVSSPWWIRNLLATGNPFYPFFVPAGAMDLSRLDFYQRVPVWRDWRAVILLPWQATFMGIDGKEGFAASIGALLIGFSPLAALGWTSRTGAQKRAMLAAAAVTVTTLVVWAIGSRISGLLIQTRLYFVMFPAWAVLAGAGFDAASAADKGTVRFGRLVRVLVLVMLGLSLFSATVNLAGRNPARSVLGLQSDKAYLSGELPAYSAAMGAVAGLPSSSRVLMLWEARGYYCQPRCDSDEVIDRWFRDARLHASAEEMIRAWHQAGYTELLVFNLGRSFVQQYDYPQDDFMHWSLLDATLAALPVEQQIANGAYTLYRIP